MPQKAREMRLPGACARCNRYLREVKQTHEEGPLAGSAKTLGEWNEGVRVVTVIMLNGSWTTIMLCAECQTEPADLRAIASRVLALSVFNVEAANRREAGQASPEYTPEQLRILRRDLLTQANNPFLGVLDEYPLTALLERTHVLPTRLS